MEIHIDTDDYDKVVTVREKLGLGMSVSVSKTNSGIAVISGDMIDCQKIIQAASEVKMDIAIIKILDAGS